MITLQQRNYLDNLKNQGYRVFITIDDLFPEIQIHGITYDCILRNRLVDLGFKIDSVKILHNPIYRFYLTLAL